MVLQESYLLTVDVKRIALTQSMKHVTNKMLVLITSNDQIYTLENVIFSARRQHKSEKEALEAKELAAATTLGPKQTNETDMLLELKSPLLPPYDGVIPQRNTKFISYDLQLVDLKNVVTFSTRLESTSAVVATGHDIFFARVTAESSFDRLHENFQSVALLATIFGLFVVLYAAQVYVQNKETKEKFLLK